MTKEKTEATLKEKLENQVKTLENEVGVKSNAIEKAKAEFNQVLGALDMAKFALEQYVIELDKSKK